MTITNGALITLLSWVGTVRAGDGNRTRMTSLEVPGNASGIVRDVGKYMPVTRCRSG